MEMNCPNCQKPLSRLGLPLQFSAARTCPECKAPYVIKYDWKVMGIIAAVGFVIAVVGLTVLFDDPPSTVITLSVVGILGVAAMFAARPKKLSN
jgi:hypothetical protein